MERKNWYRVGLTLMLLCGFNYTNAADFSALKGKQTVSYLGLGNQNEDLAFAYFENSSSSKPEVTFTLSGSLEYVSQVKVYARPYDSTNGGYNNSSVSVTDAEIWDYRDPVKKNKAILLSSTTQIPESGKAVTLASNAVLTAGKYMIYVTADIKNDLALPGLQYEKKYIGATVDKVDNSVVTTSKVNNGLSRILVPSRQLLFSPGDYYSKYYRIPSITKAADGSLIAISDARKNHVYDVKNNIDILCRRSTDNGKTWSDPITIAQGSDDGSSDGTGYGDAAIAALPNGDLLATMIHGYGLYEYDVLWQENKTNKTTNWYAISHDNGQSWSDVKEIPSSLYSNYRGCIAPGNMCVVKSGYLKGKVLACFRTKRNYAILADKSSNIILVYDPATETWSNINCSGSVEIAVKNGADDEAHLLEIGENNFLMSIRTTQKNSRAFLKLTFSSAKECSKSNVSFSGMSLTQPTNGDIMQFDAVVDGSENKYMIQTLPETQMSDGNGKNGRSSLKFFYAPMNISSGKIDWSSSLNLSDPFDGALDETAQYSSLTEQNDGTLGLVCEEYPKVIYKNESTRGEFIMASWYMNLRAEDVIPYSTTPEVEQLEAPKITPTSSTYEINSNEHPNITITNVNQFGATYYSISTKVNGTTNIVKEGSFTNDKLDFDWNSLNINPTSGTTVKVTAYCAQDGYKNSTNTVVQYVFSSDVRYLKLVAAPTPGFGNPQITVADLGTFNQETIVKVAAGTKAVIVAPSKGQFKFKQFSYDIEGNRKISDAISDVTVDNKDGYQISFPVPTVAQTPDNADNQLIIYVNYDCNLGLMTETYIYSGDVNNYKSYSPEVTSSTYPESYHKLWCSNSDFTAWPTEEQITKELIFGNPPSQDNTSNLIQFPLNISQYGLNTCIKVLPDYLTSQYFNAIVMMQKDDQYLTNPDGSYQYYLINGLLYPYSENSEIYKNAKQVKTWYKYNELANYDMNTNTLPKLVDDCTFAISNVGEDFNSFHVQVFVVTSDLTSVEPLTKTYGYVYGIVHPAIKSQIATGVDEIGNNQLVIANVNEGVSLTSSSLVNVKIYNMLGTMVNDLDVEGTKIVNLAPGVYIANGQKFIVR